MPSFQDASNLADDRNYLWAEMEFGESRAAKEAGLLYFSFNQAHRIA